jgi:hypothetical protein
MAHIDPEAAFAAVVAFLIGISSSILGRRLRARLGTECEAREEEQRASWSIYRTEGKIMSYPNVALRASLGLFAITTYAVFGLTLLYICVATGVLVLSSPRSFIAVWGFLVALTFIPPWLSFINVRKVAHEVSSKGMKKRSPWSRSFFVTWKEVRSVSYNYSLDSYIVKTDKGTIRVRAILDGIDFLLQMVSEHVPEEKRPKLMSGRRWTRLQP